MSTAFRSEDFSAEALSIVALREAGEPEIFERRTDAWKTRLTGWFQDATGRTLYDDQTEMFLIEMAAYAFALHGEDGHQALMQNLSVFAQGVWLDLMAANANMKRLPASAARVSVVAELAAPLATAVTVRKGTQLAAGAARFALDDDVVMAPGATSVAATATALDVGAASNGVQPGQATAGLGSVATGLTLRNTDVSSGGADAEGDERLRLAVIDAPEQFDRRGGWGGYGLAARRVNPAIVDVAIDRPEPGHIHLVLALAGDEPPGQALLDDVAAALDQDAVIPHGDYLAVRAGQPEDLTGTLTLRIDPSADIAAVAAAAEDRARAAIAAMRRPSSAGNDRTRFAPDVGRLGAQVAPAAITAAAMTVPGVIDAQLAGIVWQDLAFDRYPRLDDLTVTVVEAADV